MADRVRVSRPGLRRAGLLVLLTAWWGLFSAVLWACFLRPPPRSLGRTLEFLTTTAELIVPAALALFIGSVLLLGGRARTGLPAASLLTAALWLGAALLAQSGAIRF